MDLVVRALTENLDDGAWVKKVYALSVYLRAQQTLIVEMGAKCPKKTNRWLHLGMVLDFLIRHEVRITSYIDEKNAAVRRVGAIPPALTHSEWVLTHAVAPAIKRINMTFVQLQARDLLICQQRQYVEELGAALVVLFGVKNSQTEPEFANMPASDF